MSHRLQQNPGTSGGDTFFIGNGRFLRFWVSAFHSLSVFYTIWQLFYLKNKTRRCLQTVLQHWRRLNRIAVRHYLLAFAVIAIAAFVGDFLHMVHTNMFPHILLRQSRPPPIIWALAGGLRKCNALSYCTLCIQYTK